MKIDSPASSFLGFSPLQLPGLKLWLDASDLSTINTDTAAPDVDSWTDKARGVVFSQATAGQKPHTGGLLNGLNTIVFDGIDDLLVSAITNILTGSEGAIWMVFKPGATLAGSMFTTSDEATTVDSYLFRIRSDKVSMLLDPVSAGLDQNSGETSLATNTAALAYYASNGSVYDIRLNGADDGLVNITGGNNGFWFSLLTDTDNFALGAAKRSSEVQFFDGALAEVFIMDGVTPTAAQTLNADNYMLSKWFP